MVEAVLPLDAGRHPQKDKSRFGYDISKAASRNKKETEDKKQKKF